MGRDNLAVIEMDASDLSGRPDAIGDLYRGDYAALIVRGFLPPDVMERGVREIETGAVALPKVPGPIFKGCLYGRAMAASAADLSDYFRDAPAFVQGCRALFGETPPLETRVQQTLARLSGGKPAETPRTQDGRNYLPMSMRVLLAGDALPPHAENQTLKRPSSQLVRSLIDDTCLISFYIPMQIPVSGGVLTVVSSDTFRDGDGTLGGMKPAEMIERLTATGAVEILPRVGDLLIFEGGHRYHWVSPVEGPRARWTLGGFLAYSRDHERVLFWG
jgi:hypothetical protein